MVTRIYGGSDDLIEIDGEVSDEFGCYNNQKQNISCSDGTRAKIDYDGNWNITVIETGSLFKQIVCGNPAEEPHEYPDAKDCPGYSDVLILNEGIEWVRIGRKIFRAG
jgi:hypothetical protein